jgi:predicted negative regulator of RcsB-dependent stress response
MAASKTAHNKEDHEVVVDRAKDIWKKNNRIITIVGLAVILIAGGWLAYKKLYKEPNETKAAEAIFHAENYYRMDSVKQALNGDGINPGFIKIIDKYGGTKAGNLARYYAGACLLQTGDFAKAEKYLEDFDTDAKQVQARAYKLLGDAYAEQGKNKEAIKSYKSAAHHFESDEANASDYLFTAAYFAHKVLNDKQEAISLYKELKEKYPRSQHGFDADKYLAQLGVYNAD